MKNNRHSVILDIITNKDIETQDELADELKKRDIDVTQATVSRDIKQLRLIKVLSESGVYKYATENKSETGISDRLVRMFTESVLSINNANNLIVIKTVNGSAQGAAAVIDNLKWPEILGTIGGDDTILVIVKDEKITENIIERFNSMIKK